MTRKKPSCATCKAFVPITIALDAAKQLGECRRYSGVGRDIRDADEWCFSHKPAAPKKD